MPGANNEHDEQPLAQRHASDIARQFPGRLDTVELDQVAQRIERLHKAMDEVRRLPLENGDEPAPVFRSIGKEQP